MEESGEVYAQAMQRLDEVFPEVARQVRDEVARGRSVRASKLAASEIAEREGRMKDANAGKIGVKDVAVVGYSDDEQLRILLEALDTLASTMASSRRSLVALVGGQGGLVIELVAPGSDDTATVNVLAEAEAAETAWVIVNDLLEPALSELRRD